MRTYMAVALTAVMLSAPAWAHGGSVTIQAGGGPYSGAYGPYNGPTEIMRPDHGHGHHHGDACQFIPGHYEKYYRQVWVPGHYEQRYVQPVYQRQYVNGVVYTVCVSNGYYTQVWTPGYYRTITEKRWCDGYWNCRIRY